MNLGDTFEKDYYFEFEPRKNYETGKVAHKLPHTSVYYRGNVLVETVL